MLSVRYSFWLEPSQMEMLNIIFRLISIKSLPAAADCNETFDRSKLMLSLLFGICFL